MLIAFDEVIEASPRRVWSFLEDDANIPLWMPEYVETTYLDAYDEANPVGTRFLRKLKEGGRVTTYPGVVTAFEPEKLLGIRLGEGKFIVDVTYALENQGSGTHLRYQGDITLNSLFVKIMGHVFRPLTARIMRRHMANLKRVCEAEDA